MTHTDSSSVQRRYRPCYSILAPIRNDPRRVRDAPQTLPLPLRRRNARGRFAASTLRYANHRHFENTCPKRPAYLAGLFIWFRYGGSERGKQGSAIVAKGLQVIGWACGDCIDKRLRTQQACMATYSWRMVKMLY